jgi:hypothetical protein
MFKRMLGLVLVALPSLLVCGCPGLAALEQLPAEMLQVRSDVEAFETTWEAGRAAPGADAIDADVLVGCWGMYVLGEGRDGATLSLWQTLHFDAATGELRRTVVQDLFGFAAVFVQYGTFSVNAAGDVVTFTVERIDADVASGDLGDITDRYTALPVYTVNVSRAGDALTAEFLMPDDDPRTPAGFADAWPFVLVRFDCPGS